MARLFVEKRCGKWQPIRPCSTHKRFLFLIHRKVIPFSDFCLYLLYSFIVFFRRCQKSSLEPVSYLWKYTDFCNIDLRLRFDSVIPDSQYSTSYIFTCITISNRKDNGNPNTVNISPRLSSIHLIKRFLSLDPSPSTVPEVVTFSPILDNSLWIRHSLKSKGN